MARRSALTKEVREAVCTALQNGYIYEMAAVYAGVSDRSIYNWLARGREELDRREAGEPPNKKENRYVQFFQEVEEAKAIVAIEWQETVNRAAKIDPSWAFRMLQIRFPDHYAPPSRHEVSGKDGEPLVIAVVNVDVDEL